MDELDHRIVEALTRDGRTNNNQMAQALGVSEGTVRNRIKKMVESGYLKVQGLVDPNRIADKQLVFLGVKIAVTKDLIVLAEEVGHLPGVQSVHITTGRYDLIVEVLVEAKFGLIEFISGPLASVEGVTSTESFLVMKSHNKWVVP